VDFSLPGTKVQRNEKAWNHYNRRVDYTDSAILRKPGSGRPATAFSFYGLYSKFDRVKTMGTREKINAIWSTVKINLQKSVDVDMYCQQIGKNSPQKT